METPWIELLGTCLGLSGAALTVAYSVLGRITKMESRVDILWQFLLRRGVVESIQKGVLERNSPIRMPIRIWEKYKSLFQTVESYYFSDGKQLSDTDLAIQLEARFWPGIREVCLAEDINVGACLVLVMMHLRPQAQIFREWDDVAIPKSPVEHI